MVHRGVATALAAGTLLALAAPADGKVVVPLGGRVLHVGQHVELRVPGCTSAKRCRWVDGERIVLSLPSTHVGVPPKHTIARLGTVSPYGILRFRVPDVKPGTYVAVAIYPHFGWSRTTASGPFTITA